MQTVYDVQQLLKRFGTIVYIGERLASIELMEDEVKELYRHDCIDLYDYQQSLLILKNEKSRLAKKK